MSRAEKQSVLLFTNMSEQSDELHVLGKISGYYGVRGWLKIYSYTQPRENIVSYKDLKLKLANSHRSSAEQWQDIQLDSGKAHGKGVVAHFAGYDDREAAARLIGAELAVYRSEFKRTAENEYYWADLIGLNAFNLEGDELGQVVRLLETAANDVLVIKPVHQAQAEILVPYVAEHYVKKVDMDKRTILLDWPIDWNESD